MEPVRPFSSLTRRGQLRRLLRLACQVNLINYVLDRKEDSSAMLDQMFSRLQSMLAAFREFDLDLKFDELSS